MPPFYYKNPSEDGLFAFFSEVIQRVGDARLRLYLYHFPQLSTVPIPVGLVARLKRDYGGVIAGLKDSSGDWQTTATFLKEFPGFGVFSGSEEFLLPNLRAGGVGCISASTNVTAPLARPVYAAWRGREADALQQGLTEVRLIFQAFPLQAALKEVMALITGQDVLAHPAAAATVRSAPPSAPNLPPASRPCRKCSRCGAAPPERAGRSQVP